MVPAEDYVDRNDVPNLSPRSRENLEKALDLEVQKRRLLFLRLATAPRTPCPRPCSRPCARTEAEHASLLCKLLKVPKPEIKPDEQGLPEGPQGQLRRRP